MDRVDQLRNKKSFSFTHRAKDAIFCLYDQIVSSFILNGIGLIAFLIIETLTLVHSLILVHKNTSGDYLSPIYEYLQYINPAYLVSLPSTVMFTNISFLGLGILPCLLFMVMLLAQWNAGSQVKYSLAYSYILRIAGILFTLTKYVLFQPIVAVLATSMWCTDGIFGESGLGYTCYSNEHLALLFFSALTILLLVTLSLLSIVLFTDEQLDSKLPWAYVSRMYEVYKLCWKLAISFMIHISYNSQSVGAFACVPSFLISLFGLYELYKLAYMNDRKVYYALIITETSILWFSLATLLELVSGVNLGNPLLFGVIFLVFAPIVVFISIWRREKLLLVSNIGGCFDTFQVEVYARIFYDNLGSKRQIVDSSIDGLISIHASVCTNSQCPCHTIIALQRSEENEEDKESVGLKKDIPSKNQKLRNDKTIEQIIETDLSGKTELSAVYTKFLICEVEQWGQMHEKKAKLHLLLAYLKLYCFDNPLAALWELMAAEEEGPDLYEQFQIFRLMNRIEDQVIRKESVDESSENIDRLIKFQQLLAEMQEDMQEALKLYTGFWKELQDESPNFQYLGGVSYEIDELATKIRRTYKELIMLNPINIYCRMLYAIFIKKIIKDDFEALDVSRETNTATNNLRLHNKYTSEDKFGANSRNALFIISGQKVNLGEVLCINNEVSELLGYEKHEVLGHNISKVMPPAIAAKHSGFMLKFMCSGKFSPSRDKLIFPLHKLGYIVPSTYIHRVVPTLQRGLQLIGFIRTIQDFSEYCPIVERNTSSEDVVLFLVDEDWKLHAFNVRAAKLFGINPAQANMRKFLFSEEKTSMLKLIPQLSEGGFSVSEMGGEVVLNPRIIQKIMESDIEIVRSSSDPSSSKENDYNNTYGIFDTLVEANTPVSELNIRAPLSILDLEYGKTEKSGTPDLKMRVVMLMIEQLLDNSKVPQKVTDGNVPYAAQKMKRKDEIMFDEIASQSQSSSSSGSVETEQRIIRNLKEKIKEHQSPFFVRCFIKLGILIFLLIFSTAIMEYVLKRLLISFVDDSFDTAQVVANRYSTLMSIPYSFSVLLDIYQYRDVSASEGFANRTKAYSKFAEDRLERLREYTNTLSKRRIAYSAKNRYILEEPIIMFSELPKPSSVRNEVFYMNYTITVAINQYVAKGTQLKEYSIPLIQAGKNWTDAETDNSMYRLMKYMIDNGKGTLSYYMEKSFYNYIEDFTNDLSTKVSVMKIVLITDPIVAIILLFMFIPFILKVQSSLQRIYLHLCQFQVADIKKWLDACNNSASDIKASITQMQRIYNEETFEINPADYDKRNREDRDSPKATTKLRGDTTEAKNKPGSTETGQSSNNKGEDDEEEEGMVVQSQEAAISERKQRTFSEMSREKTKAYLVYLAFFILYIAAFKVADAILLANFYKDTEIKLGAVRLFNRRGWDQDNAMYFFRLNIMQNKLHSYFEREDAAGYYVNEGFEREFDVSKNRANYMGDLEKLKNLLNRLDSLNYCNALLEDPNLINLCKTEYEGIGVIGFNSMMINMLNYIKLNHEQFKQHYKEGTDFRDLVISSGELTKMSDIRYKYGYNTTNTIIDLIMTVVRDWTAAQIQEHDIKFAFYIIFLFLIFTFLWRKMVANMKMDIIKALGILNILPTLHLASAPEFISEINKSSLTN